MDGMLNNIIAAGNNFFAGAREYLDKIFSWVSIFTGKFPGWVLLIVGLWVAARIFKVRANLNLGKGSR